MSPIKDWRYRYFMFDLEIFRPATTDHTTKHSSLLSTVIFPSKCILTDLIRWIRQSLWSTDQNWSILGPSGPLWSMNQNGKPRIKPTVSVSLVDKMSKAFFLSIELIIFIVLEKLNDLGLSLNKRKFSYFLKFWFDHEKTD